MHAKTFLQWMWYEQVEPFGELRADWRAASIIAMVHNVTRKVEHQKRPKDFLLKFEEEKPVRKRTAEEEARDLKILIYALAGAKE